MQFTIRNLRVAVAVAAGWLAVLLAGREILPGLVLLGLPLAGLFGLRARVPPQRPAWRFGILAVMLGPVILGGGWLWARCVIWSFQRETGAIAIGSASRGAYYEFWGLTVPGAVTGMGLMAYVLWLAIRCMLPRRLGPFLLLPVVVAYAFVLAFGWFALFVPLAFEAFD